MNGRWTGRLLAGLVLAVLCAACGSGETAIPIHLHGVWTTDAPRYGNRYMELRSRHLLFGIRDESVDVYTVSLVEQRAEEGKKLYIITYGDGEGVDFKLSFYHGIDGGNEIVFKYQSHLRWKRTER